MLIWNLLFDLYFLLINQLEILCTCIFKFPFTFYLARSHYIMMNFDHVKLYSVHSVLFLEFKTTNLNKGDSSKFTTYQCIFYWGNLIYSGQFDVVWHWKIVSGSVTLICYMFSTLFLFKVSNVGEIKLCTLLKDCSFKIFLLFLS